MLSIEQQIALLPRPNASPLNRALRAMNVGDSVLVPKDSYKSPVTPRTIAARAGKVTGFMFASRTVSDGIRIWRIE